jgi:hypothetical protein
MLPSFSFESIICNGVVHDEIEITVSVGAAIPVATIGIRTG